MNDDKRNDGFQPGDSGANEHGTGSSYDPTKGTYVPTGGTAGGHTSAAGATGQESTTGQTGYGTGQAGQAGGAGQGAGGQGGRTVTEEFRVSGEAVVSKVKELVREGNVRRITIKNDDGKVLIEIPLTIGVIGTVLLPVWAAIGAIAALVANLTISVEKTVDPSTMQGDRPGDMTRS